MKRTVAFIILLLLMLALAACGENGADGTSGGSGVTYDLLDLTYSTETGDDIENTEGGTMSIPIPENVTITNSYDGLTEQWREFTCEAVYQQVADYIARLESLGFTSNVEKWNDGIYHVTITKDMAFVTIEFVHDNRDDIFENMVANGEEITGTLRGRAYQKK